MAATIQLHEMSALDAGGDKTSGIVRFKDADNAVVDLNNPLVDPCRRIDLFVQQETSGLHGSPSGYADREPAVVHGRGLMGSARGLRPRPRISA